MGKGKEIPSVGGSIGIERIFSLMEAKYKNLIRRTETQVLVTSMGKNLTAKRMETLGMLWKEGIKAETLYVENPKSGVAFDFAFDNGIPLVIIIGEDEVVNGIYGVKVLNENR